MPELSPAAQHWEYIILVWVGLGSLAGLLARMILPVREPSGALATLTLGITGSALGLGGLSWWVGNRPFNPLGPSGFLAATGGAFVLLVFYHLVHLITHRGDHAKDEP